MGDAEIARQFVRNIPGAKIEIMPGAGHAVWIDDPDQAAAATRRFLSGEPPIDEQVNERPRIS